MNVELILDELDIDWKPSGNGWGIAKCPLHDDSSPSMSISFEFGWFKCFSGCGEGGLVDLAVRMIALGHKINLATVLALSASSDELSKERTPSEVAKVIKRLEARRNDILDERMLAEYLDYSPHIAKRGISKEVAKWHGIRYDFIEEQIIIPIRDHNGGLRGIESRTVIDRKPKYFPVIECDKSNWLWGAYKYPAWHPLVVFEGALGACRATTLGIKGAVALLTSSVSNAQVMRLAQAKKVTIVLDNDAAGIKGAKNLHERLTPMTEVGIVDLPKDIDEIGGEELDKVVKACRIFRMW